MTVREVILALLDHPFDCEVYVGKGMGPLSKVESTISDKIYVVVSP